MTCKTCKFGLFYKLQSLLKYTFTVHFDIINSLPLHRPRTWSSKCSESPPWFKWFCFLFGVFSWFLILCAMVFHLLEFWRVFCRLVWVRTRYTIVTLWIFDMYLSVYRVIWNGWGLESVIHIIPPLWISRNNQYSTIRENGIDKEMIK